ncbi:hypothetical protein K4105_05620, partial [Buchnera aphidicola]|nr:hypothetical protein [Buchnera aphidicola]
EANVIKEALNNVNIKSMYTSHQENIFHTKDSKELLCILKAILEPTNEHLLQQSTHAFFFQKLVFEKNHKNKKND